MNELGKPKRKTSHPKIEKKQYNQSEIAACERKITVNFCSNTAFSLYFKIRVKKFHAAKPLFFAPLPVLAWAKSQLQFYFKNHENV